MTKVSKLEKQISKLKQKLAKERKKVKPQLVNDYVFAGEGGRPVTLSSLFRKKKELILIHNMGSTCAYCTLWADGFNGLTPHLEDRASFVVESADKQTTMTKFKKSRGWKFKMVSSYGTQFRKDMGYADQEGVWPGVSAFIKKGKQIYRVSNSLLGPGDNYCVAWDLIDLLPGSSQDWSPKFKY